MGAPPAPSPVRPAGGVRVFGNMYPALRRDASGPPEARCHALPMAWRTLFQRQPGLGEHEVVVYSSDHDDSLATVTPEHLAEILAVVRDRCRALAGRGRYRYVLPFCNHGPAAGATLAHPHLQIIATPEVPLLVAEKARRPGGLSPAPAALPAVRSDRRRGSGRRARRGRRRGVVGLGALGQSPRPWELCLAAAPASTRLRTGHGR